MFYFSAFGDCIQSDNGLDEWLESGLYKDKEDGKGLILLFESDVHFLLAKNLNNLKEQITYVDKSFEKDLDLFLEEVIVNPIFEWWKNGGYKKYIDKRNFPNEEEYEKEINRLKERKDNFNLAVEDMGEVFDHCGGGWYGWYTLVDNGFELNYKGEKIVRP